MSDYVSRSPSSNRSGPFVAAWASGATTLPTNLVEAVGTAIVFFGAARYTHGIVLSAAQALCA